jgi:hypothetical protein
MRTCKTQKQFKIRWPVRRDPKRNKRTKAELDTYVAIDDHSEYWKTIPTWWESCPFVCFFSFSLYQEFTEFRATHQIALKLLTLLLFLGVAQENTPCHSEAFAERDHWRDSVNKESQRSSLESSWWQKVFGKIIRAQKNGLLPALRCQWGTRTIRNSQVIMTSFVSVGLKSACCCVNRSSLFNKWIEFHYPFHSVAYWDWAARQCIFFRISDLVLHTIETREKFRVFFFCFDIEYIEVVEGKKIGAAWPASRHIWGKTWR